MPRKLTPTRPMRKWCDDCEQLKDNPDNLKHPKYCPECRTKRWIEGLKKRDKYYEKIKNKK